MMYMLRYDYDKMIASDRIIGRTKRVDEGAKYLCNVGTYVHIMSIIYSVSDKKIAIKFVKI